MQERKEDTYSLYELLGTVFSFLGYLGKRWWALAIAASLGAGAGAFYNLFQKPKYEAVSTFILEEKSSMSGGIAGLASQFGLNLGGLSGGAGLFSGDNILNILKSKNVVAQVLLTPLEKNSPDRRTLADAYLDFSGLKEKWQSKPHLAKINFSSGNSLTALQDSVLNVIYEAVIEKHLTTERISKQGTIIKVQVTAADRRFAGTMTEKLIEEAGKLYLNIRVGTAQENIRQLQRRSDSLLVLLNRKSFTAAASQPIDINPGLKTAIVPVEIANRDKTVLATLYAEVTKNLEASKLLLSQQTPVIQSLDKPSDLLKDKRKSLPILLIAGMFFGGVVGAFILFLSFQMIQAKKEQRVNGRVRVVEPTYQPS